MSAQGEWKCFGSCRGQDPKLFLPDDTGDRNATQASYRQALEFCATCPAWVVDQCLEFALAEGQTWGVWGNTTPRQRRTIREQRQAADRVRT